MREYHINNNVMWRYLAILTHFLFSLCKRLYDSRCYIGSKLNLCNKKWLEYCLLSRIFSHIGQCLNRFIFSVVYI
jgi:hypothetical protein